MSEMTPPPLPPAKPRLAAILFAGLIGALCAVAAIAAIGVGAKPQLGKWLLADERGRLDKIEARLELIEAALAAAKPGPAGDPAPENDPQRMERLSGEIEQLRRAIPPEGLILRLTERSEAAEKSMRAMAEAQSTSQALMVGVAQLREAINRGDSFALELAALRKQLPSEDASLLEPLTESAEHGIWRRDQLLQRLAPLTEQLLTEERAASGPGLWPVIWSNLHKVIAIRRIDGKGNDSEAVLGRVEIALDKDDWDQALFEMHGLRGKAAIQAAEWRQQAEWRVSADHALSKLTAWAALRLSGHRD